MLALLRGQASVCLLYLTASTLHSVLTYALVSVTSVWVICSRLGHEKWQIIFFICIQTAFIGALSTVGVDEKGKAIALVFIMACCINQPLYMLFAMVSFNLVDQADM